MNLFIFHRDLRLIDNTTLIQQIREFKEITPIFIFTPEQIDPKKNDYFSNNSVQFMIESLHELDDEIKKYNGCLTYFKGDTIDVIQSIHNVHPIQSIAYNIDYTPYAIERDTKIKKLCDKYKIKHIAEEDYVLHPILKLETTKKDKTPYQKFTSFKNQCSKLNVKSVDSFKQFQFKKYSFSKYIIHDIDSFYEPNLDINVHGGRKNGLSILKNIKQFKDYDSKRDTLTYKTTFLSAHNHFSTVSIREVYYSILNSLGHSNLINELYWRDFYVNITYFFPHVLNGQINHLNKPFKENYSKIKWSNHKNYFIKWCKGETGFPIIDAGMRQLNKTGFMHNRTRMCVSMFLTKDLHISWLWGEKYFATKLVDYSPMQNNGGWQWSSSTGTDSQPYFRIFNPWTQTLNFDKDCQYIKTWIPELKDVPVSDILNWEVKYKDYDVYFEPIIDHNKERLKTLELFSTKTHAS